jgi:GWxTD domain-containing protein
MRQRIVVWLILLAGIALALLVLFSGCVTYRLERALPKDIREWYDLHQNIMLYPVPDYISPKKMTEARYFLGLSPELQRKYTKLFWTIRWVEAESMFKTTVKLANIAFRGEGVDGWRTERGRMLLMLGQPDDIFQYKKVRGQDFSRAEPSFEGEEEWDGFSQHYQNWVYRYGRGFFQNQAVFTFEYNTQQRRWIYPSIWRTEQLQCREYYQHFMSPIEWEPWLKEIGGK